MDAKGKLYKNVIWGFGGQAVILVLGIIVPRVMLTNYGSDVNGLVSTITQIFTYMALLEAGVGQAARNALYKPIIENNKEKISYVASVAKSYFRKLTFFYGVGVLILTIFVPFVLKSNVDKLTISLVVLFQGLAGVISFYFVETQTVILTADGRGYVNNGINIVNQIFSYSARIILAYLGLNIALLQFVYCLITIAKVIIYKIYFKRNYSWLKLSKVPKNAKLKDRNAYIITEVAWTLFSSTDMIVLSAFISTQIASVYSIYNMVFTSLNVLMNAIYSSVVYILGQTYHQNKMKYQKIHDVFTSIFLGSMTILMCISYVLIIPFVKLYTNGVNDINYIYHALPVLFCLVQILSWSRYVSGNLTAIAGYARQVSVISMIEALINVVLSIILVSYLGITGVLLATVLALPLKVIYCAYISDKIVLHRSPWKTIKILGINYLLFLGSICIASFLNFKIQNYIEFVKYGIIITTGYVIIGVFLNVIANPECLKVKKYLTKE